MELSKTAKEAVNYIQYATKKKFNVQEFGAPTVEHKDSYQHEHVANAMVKIIAMTPGLSATNKSVMCMKVINPGISDIQVALALCIDISSVKRYEENGKRACASFLKRVSQQENIDKFNVERAVEADLKNLNKQKSNPLMAD